MGTTNERPRFEQVDWSEIDRTSGWLSTQRATLLVGLALVLAGYLYDTSVARVYLIGTWQAEPIDWVILVAVVVVLAYGVVPAIGRQAATRRLLRRLGSKPTVVLAGSYLLVLGIVSVIGPTVYPDPGLHFDHVFQPPFGFSRPTLASECVGKVTGTPFEKVCHGTLTYPLGTSLRGVPMGYFLVTGARVAVYITVFAVAFVVPVAAAVGIVAGLYGGVLDDILMAYIDIQLSIPAIVLYLVGYAYWNPSLLLLLVTFGLLSWGGIARLVRSEVLQRRENGHVLVARSLGASRRYIATRHILPNITNTLVPAVFHLLAILVLVEAGIAFLGFHQLEFHSWGATISESMNAAVPALMQNRSDYPAYQVWWASTLPALALALTMLSFKLLGDGLRDALDPRGE